MAWTIGDALRNKEEYKASGNVISPEIKPKRRKPYEIHLKNISIYMHASCTLILMMEYPQIVIFQKLIINSKVTNPSSLGEYLFYIML